MAMAFGGLHPWRAVLLYTYLNTSTRTLRFVMLDCAYDQVKLRYLLLGGTRQQSNQHRQVGSGVGAYRGLVRSWWWWLY